MFRFSFILLLSLCADVEVISSEDGIRDVQKLVETINNITQEAENETILVLCDAGWDKSKSIKCLTSNCTTSDEDECNFQADTKNGTMVAPQSEMIKTEMARHDDGENVWYIFPVFRSDAENEIYLTHRLQRVINNSSKIKLVWVEEDGDIRNATLLNTTLSHSVHLISDMEQYKNSVSFVVNDKVDWNGDMDKDNLNKYFKFMVKKMIDYRKAIKEQCKDRKVERKCQLTDALLSRNYTVKNSTHSHRNLSNIGRESCRIVRESILNHSSYAKVDKNINFQKFLSESAQIMLDKMENILGNEIYARFGEIGRDSVLKARINSNDDAPSKNILSFCTDGYQNVSSIDQLIKKGFFYNLTKLHLNYTERLTKDIREYDGQLKVLGSLRAESLGLEKLNTTLKDMCDQLLPKSTYGVILPIFLSCVLALVTAFLISVLFYYHKRVSTANYNIKRLKKELYGNAQDIKPTVPLIDQIESLKYDRKYEFMRENLELGEKLGEGAFGVVLKAIAKGIIPNEEQTTVAVKTINPSADFEAARALVSELKIMTYLDKHENIVNLLGAVTDDIGKKDLLIVVEFCRFGNVRDFLVDNRHRFIDQIDPDTDMIDATVTDNGKGSGETSTVSPGYTRLEDLDKDNSNPPITSTNLLSWSRQVARGMQYLASRQILHGDLAARNILLCDDNIVKICDFGLARSLYRAINYKKKGNDPLPLKWLALESIKDHVFSTQTDVWSFGIFMWELFSLGEVPYPSISMDELYNKLKDGYRMEKPPHATQQLYDIMLSCWVVNHELRPSFNNLETSFYNLLTRTAGNIDMGDPYLKPSVIDTTCEKNYLTTVISPEYQAPSPPCSQQMEDEHLEMIERHEFDVSIHS